MSFGRRARPMARFATSPIEKSLRRSNVATLVLVTVALGNLYGVAGASSKTLVVSVNGLTSAPLGTRESAAMARLTNLFGEPTAPLEATRGLRNCGVDASASWHALSVYFDHAKLVGVALGPGKSPMAVTSRGLRLGDSLRRAEGLYGNALRTSTNQGGAWFVTTSNGTLDGFLYPSNGHPTSNSSIMTIDAGVVGCPAMSP